jgi:hypothetical protein
LDQDGSPEDYMEQCRRRREDAALAEQRKTEAAAVRLARKQANYSRT